MPAYSELLAQLYHPPTLAVHSKEKEAVTSGAHSEAFQEKVSGDSIKAMKAKNRGVGFVFRRVSSVL